MVGWLVGWSHTHPYLCPIDDRTLFTNLMGDIVDNGIVVGDIPYIWKIGALMLLVTAIGAVVSVTSSYFSSKVAMALARDIRRQVFKHVSQFSLQEFDEVGTASLITRTTNDITQIQKMAIKRF